MKTLKRLLACLCTIFTYGTNADAIAGTNACSTTSVIILVPTVRELIAMSTTEFKLWRPYQEKTVLVINTRQVPVLEPTARPTNSVPSKEVMALSRTLSRSRASEENERFPLSKRLSFGLSRTEPEIGGIRASLNWKLR